MESQTTSETRERTPAQAAGYILGTLTGIVQTVMPVRMWITTIASVTLVAYVCNISSLAEIARALCCYIALMVMITVPAIFKDQPRR